MKWLKIGCDALICIFIWVGSMAFGFGLIIRLGLKDSMVALVAVQVVAAAASIVVLRRR